LQMLKEVNATGRRKLPDDAPTDFLPQRLKPIVINHGEIDRRAWECALLLKLRDELKAGNLSVRYPKRFARLEDFFIDDRHWQGMREDFFRRSGLPSDTEQVPKSLAPKGRASAPEPAGAFPGRQSSFDFRAQVCHSAPMERHAFGLRFRPNVLAPQKGFRVASIVNEFKET